MTKVVLVVEYDGSRYHGFQYQTNALTVQAEIEMALKRLTGDDIRVLAASRTDAGVHARGQVVSFGTRASFPPRVWVRALNHYLPEFVSVRRAYLPSDDFDVRRQATSRVYRYSILNRLSRSPLKRGCTYHFPQPLDVAAMDLASRELLGEHDFSSFTSVEVGRPVRTVHRAAVERRGEMVMFNMEANSFLPHQIRHTAGALLQVGRGRMGVEQFRELLQARTRGLAGPALPASGLCLVQVNYPVPLGDQDEDL